MVLVVLVVVLGLIVWGIAALVGGGNGGSSPTPTTSAGGSADAAGTDGASPSAEGGTTPTEQASPRVSDYPTGSTPPPPGACPPEWASLSVTAPDSTPSGQPVPATIHVTTIADADPCLVDLGAQSLTVDVYSGEDHVWSSQECPFSPESRSLLLPADATDVAEVRWNGYRSSSGCGTDGEVALPGTYRYVVTHTLDGQTLTAETTFLVG